MRLRVHGTAPQCWCGPVKVYTTATGRGVWLCRPVHKAEDPRQPPPFVVAIAIALAVYGDDSQWPYDVALGDEE